MLLNRRLELGRICYAPGKGVRGTAPASCAVFHWEVCRKARVKLPLLAKIAVYISHKVHVRNIHSYFCGHAHPSRSFRQSGPVPTRIHMTVVAKVSGHAGGYAKQSWTRTEKC
jgi:hypothetical protein